MDIIICNDTQSAVRTINSIQAGKIIDGFAWTLYLSDDQISMNYFKSHQNVEITSSKIS